MLMLCQASDLGHQLGNHATKLSRSPKSLDTSRHAGADAAKKYPSGATRHTSTVPSFRYPRPAINKDYDEKG